MCKYCRIDKNDNADPRELFDKTITVKEKALCDNGVFEVKAEYKRFLRVALGCYHNELSLMINNQWQTDEDEKKDAISYCWIKNINYCPMCGRKLNDISE